MTRLGGVGVYGKIAAQPDFVRSGAGAFSKAGLDRWFQEGMETLRSEKTSLPGAPTFFMSTPSDGSTAFVGVFAPSADAAGRAFPLAIFAEAGVRELASRFPSWPASYAPFTAEAALLAVKGAEADAEALVAQAQSLDPTARGPQPAWEKEPVGTLLESLGGSPGLGYALRTMLAAIETTKSGNILTLDLPASNPETRAFWLEMIGRLLNWRDLAPSVLWTDGSDGRVLVTLGPPVAGAFGYLANPKHRSSRFWPARTTAETAMSQALSSLSARQRQTVEDPTATLGDLSAIFA